MFDVVMPELLSSTSTTPPLGMQLGQIAVDPSTGYLHQLLVTNSGLTAAVASGTVMASVAVATPFIVERMYASGGAGSFNLAKGIACGAPGSGTYFWAMIKGYHSKIYVAAGSGTFASAGMSLVGSTTQSGAVSGVASGTAPTHKIIGFVSTAQATGVTALSGVVTLAF